MGSGPKQHSGDGLRRPEHTLPRTLDAERAAREACRRVRGHRKLRRGVGREPHCSRRGSGRRTSCAGALAEAPCKQSARGAAAWRLLLLAAQGGRRAGTEEALLSEEKPQLASLGDAQPLQRPNKANVKKWHGQKKK